MAAVRGRPKRQPATRRRRPVDEHAWHDCPTPPPPGQGHPGIHWHCPICDAAWIWRRPPRPTAQWIRATPEDH